MTVGESRRGVPAEPATYRALLAEPQFVSLWLAQAISLTGDQLARVAIATMVFRDTGSGFITALVYAVTYVPWLIGGPLLGGLADRYPPAHRDDVLPAAERGAGRADGAARDPRCRCWPRCCSWSSRWSRRSCPRARRCWWTSSPTTATCWPRRPNQVTVQAAQVVGFAVGGLVVGWLGPTHSLVVDAGTFLFAAALIRIGVRPRSSLGGAEVVGGSWQRIKGRRQGGVRRPPAARAGPARLAASFWVVPEGLAAPYTKGQPGALGLLLAAQPIGSVVGGVLLSRLVRPTTRLEIMGGLAVLSCAPLIAFVVSPPLPVAIGLLLLSGLGTTYNLPANAAFMQALPAERRGQAFGLVSAGLVAGQGISIAVAGAITEVASPGMVIGVAGGLGLVAALALSGAGRRFLATASPAVS